MDGADQFGFAIIDGAYVASMWSGSAASWRSLNPSGSSFAVVLGADGGQQVGQSNNEAGRWSGTRESWVSLHPPGAAWSTATGIWQNHQVGSASFGDQRSRAGMWTGSASSWVSLHPSGSVFNSLSSYALAVSESQQVGYVQGLLDGTPEGNWAACVWTGSAASWVNLHPAGASRSIAYDVWNGMQVGDAVFPGGQRALLWHGSAEGYEDLSIPLAALTNGQPWSSIAYDIWADATTIYVIGQGFNPVLLRREAVLWSRPIPTPHATTTLAALGLTLLRRRRGRGSL